MKAMLNSIHFRLHPSAFILCNTRTLAAGDTELLYFAAPPVTVNFMSSGF